MQQQPLSIQVEFTEGCNLYCKFCGIRGMRTGPTDFKYLTLELARLIARQIRETGWTPRMEFAMHGEPTLNPHYVEIVAIFRERLPDHQLMITSNGYDLAKDPDKKIKELFDAGLNLLALDDYGHATVREVKEKYTGEKHFYPEEIDASAHKRWSPDTHTVVFIHDIRTATRGGHRTLYNHCGCAFPPLRSPLKKRCARPFREISIRWDGNIAMCCNDFRGYYKCGNVEDQHIADIWQSEYFNAARRMLYHYDRSFYPCSVCDATSMRVGLLPDKLGKETVPKPTDMDRKIAARAIEGKPYSRVVDREWKPATQAFWTGKKR